LSTIPLVRGIRFCPPASLFAMARDVIVGPPDWFGVGVGVLPPGVGVGVAVGVGVVADGVKATSLEKALSAPDVLYAVMAK